MNLKYQVRKLIEKEGMTATKAYEIIGDSQNKEAVTIRRDYERYISAIEQRAKKEKENQERLLEQFTKYREGAAKQTQKIDGDK